jgi:hypothetical protein
VLDLRCQGAHCGILKLWERIELTPGPGVIRASLGKAARTGYSRGALRLESRRPPCSVWRMGIHWKLGALGACCASLACTPSSTREGMRIRAADEWNCPKSTITVTNEGQNTFRVTGCGQSALYGCSEGAAGSDTDPHGTMASEEEYRQRGADCTKLSRK